MLISHFTRATLIALASSVALAACAATPHEGAATPFAYTQSESRASTQPTGGNPSQLYGARKDGGFTIPAVDAKRLKPEHVRQVVDYRASEKPGTIVVDQTARYLYFVLPGGKAIRYAVGVGPVARAFPGVEAEIAWKAKWPRWTPTQSMIERNPKQYARNAGGVAGGPHNPMGARALYMHQNGVDTYYRVHGTNDPSSIGKAVSAGCIRLLNQDIIDLHDRVKPGAKIVVR
ncbi:L,D-transpeptidase [Corticibacterium sp. UT-5YL-CI-8]|nr:L,D-transpeptidase [Tianweitania sp. UT-5YL-CI-8]